MSDIQEAIRYFRFMLQMNKQFHRAPDLCRMLPIAISALEKQKPQKAIHYGIEASSADWIVECPACGARTQGTRIMPPYCANCGQKFDWSEKDG